MFDLQLTHGLDHFDGFRVAIRYSKCKVNIAVLFKLILKKQTPVGLIIITSAKSTDSCNEAHLPFHLSFSMRIRNNIDFPLKTHKPGQVDNNKGALLATGCSNIEIKPKIEAMGVDIVL